MDNLTLMEFQNQRILTTKQLAEVYGVDEIRIRQGFTRNTSKFAEGKHYYKIQGKELKEFKAKYLNDTTLKFSSELILWTERGASRHCKILDTDKAWQQFDNLEERYFRAKPLMQPSYLIDDQIQRAQAWIREQEEKQQLKLVTKRQQQIIGELKPKADYTDTILQNKGLVTITQISKDYGMSGQAMNDLLHELDIQYKQSGQWLLYAEYQGKGYTHSRTIDIVRKDGTPDVKMYTKWTQKGRLFLYELLRDNGVLPAIEQEEVTYA